jgi:hypothetical protein
VNDINHPLKFCHERLTKLSAKLEQYTRAMMKQKGNRTVRNQLFKVKWIFTSEEADRLQNDLSIHVRGWRVTLRSLECEYALPDFEPHVPGGFCVYSRLIRFSQIMLRTMKQSRTSMTKAVASIEQTVTEIHHSLTNLHMELPKILGYVWEGGFSAHDKPVIFYGRPWQKRANSLLVLHIPKCSYL